MDHLTIIIIIIIGQHSSRCSFQCLKMKLYVDRRQKRENIEVVYKSALVWTRSQWPLRPKCGISWPLSHSVESVNPACRQSIGKHISVLRTKHLDLSAVFVTWFEILVHLRTNRKSLFLEGKMCLGKVNFFGMMHVLTDSHILKFNNAALQPEGHETHSTHKWRPANSFKTLQSHQKFNYQQFIDQLWNLWKRFSICGCIWKYLKIIYVFVGILLWESKFPQLTKYLHKVFI